MAKLQELSIVGKAAILSAIDRLTYSENVGVKWRGGGRCMWGHFTNHCGDVFEEERLRINLPALHNLRDRSCGSASVSIAAATTLAPTAQESMVKGTLQRFHGKCSRIAR